MVPVNHTVHNTTAAAVGLDAGSLQALRLLTWLVHARSEYRRLWADAGGPPGRAALRSSLFVALWEEELRRAR